MTPARPRARAHAMLPVTSSSNRRRSKRNDAPNSNASGSGAPSNLPDHSVVIGFPETWRRCAPSDDDASSVLGVRFQPLHQRRSPLAVSGDGPDRLGELGAVEGFGERLRLTTPGAQHDELLHALDAAQEFGDRPL